MGEKKITFFYKIFHFQFRVFIEICVQKFRIFGFQFSQRRGSAKFDTVIQFSGLGEVRVKVVGVGNQWFQGETWAIFICLSFISGIEVNRESTQESINSSPHLKKSYINIPLKATYKTL